MKRLLLGCAAALVLTCPGDLGVAADISPAQVAAFTPGVTTYDDVVRALGTPSNTTAASDGTRTIVYVSSHTHVKAATFIPVIGLFAGGATGSTSATAFSFGPDGRLIRSVTSDTNVDCSVNVVSAACNTAAPAVLSPEPTATTSTPMVVLGASFADLPALTATMLGHPEMKAAMVLSVAPGSVAERGGLRPGDCVTTYGGRAVVGGLDLASDVHATVAGSKVEATILRAGQSTELDFQF